MGMMSAIRSGLGIAVLPCIVADGEPDLVQCVPPRDDHHRRTVDEEFDHEPELAPAEEIEVLPGDRALPRPPGGQRPPASAGPCHTGPARRRLLLLGAK